MAKLFKVSACDNLIVELSVVCDLAGRNTIIDTNDKKKTGLWSGMVRLVLDFNTEMDLFYCERLDKNRIEASFILWNMFWDC